MTKFKAFVDGKLNPMVQELHKISKNKFPMLHCAKALSYTNGDIEKALIWMEQHTGFFFELYILYLELRCGYLKCRDAFHIWKNVMTWDLERLNKRCFGLNAFDEFYATLNGGWRGV